MRSAYDLRSEARIHHHTEPGAQDLQKVFLLHTDMQLFVNMYIYMWICICICICTSCTLYIYIYMYTYVFFDIAMFNDNKSKNNWLVKRVSANQQAKYCILLTLEQYMNIYEP